MFAELVCKPFTNECDIVAFVVCAGTTVADRSADSKRFVVPKTRTAFGTRDFGADGVVVCKSEPSLRISLEGADTSRAVLCKTFLTYES